MESIFLRLSPELQRTFQYLYEQRDRPILIVGNAPSLSSIDYSLYPDNPLIVRINNFFFEDKYYVGKHVDLVFCATHHKKRLLAYYLTLQDIIRRQEYILSNYACIATPYEIEHLRDIDPLYNIIDVQECFKTIPYCVALHASLYTKNFLDRPHPTTGISALCLMVLLGFTRIYIAGIELYAGKVDESAYVYNMEKKNNMRKSYYEDVKAYTNGKATEFVHKQELEISALTWCKEQAQGGIFSLCPTASLLNSIIPMARARKFSVYYNRTKPQDSLQDYLEITSHI